MNHSSLKKKGRRTPASRPKSASSRMSNGVKYKGTLSAQTAREPAKRVSLQEYSINALRNSRFWTLSQSSSSFTGLDKNRIIGAPYASTSNYLRQQMLSEIEKQIILAETSKQPNQGSRTYKTPEEYYDEVIALKKQIQDLTNENAVLKIKTQRTEEEYFLRKQRDSELQCMDSTKVEQTLRQKLATLERAMRDKDATLSKLQNDLKTTKLEEMKVRLEVYADEIRRLKRCKETRGKKLSSGSSRAFVTEETSGRMKSLVTTLRKMGAEKARLIKENKLLKEDLQRSMEEKEGKLNPSDKYEDMTKKELLSTVAKMQLKIERLESVDDDRIRVRKSSRADIEGKLSLDGGLAERLDQLDKRETELLEEVAKKSSVIAQLKEDRTYYREKCSENEQEVKSLHKEIDELQLDLSGRHSNNRSDIQRPSSVSGRQSPRPSITSRRSSRADRDQPPKVETFRRNRAAKVIQRGWRQHARYSCDEDKEIALIQSTLKGHRNRRLNLSRLRGFMADEDEVEDDEEDSEDDAVERIQSALKGHRFRSLQLTRRNSNASSIQSFSPRGASKSNPVQSPRSYYHRPSRPAGAMREADEDRYSEISIRSNRTGSTRTGLKDVNGDRYSPVSARTSLVSGRITPASHTRSQLSGRHGPARPLNSVADDSDDDDDIPLRSGRRPIF